jgi:hypothetical protein
MTGDRNFSISGSTSAKEEIVPLSDIFLHSIKHAIPAVIAVSKHLIIEPKQKLVLQYTKTSTVFVPAINLQKIFEAAFPCVRCIDPSVQADTLSNISATSDDFSSIINELIWAQADARDFNYCREFARQRELRARKKRSR